MKVVSFAEKNQSFSKSVMFFLVQLFFKPMHKISWNFVIIRRWCEDMHICRKIPFFYFPRNFTFIRFKNFCFYLLYYMYWNSLSVQLPLNCWTEFHQMIRTWCYKMHICSKFPFLYLFILFLIRTPCVNVHIYRNIVVFSSILSLLKS